MQYYLSLKSSSKIVITKKEVDSLTKGPIPYFIRKTPKTSEGATTEKQQRTAKRNGEPERRKYSSRRIPKVGKSDGVQG